MENLGGISLGQNKSVQVIRVGEKVYLLGVGENVELLKEISDQNLIDELIHKNDQNFDTKSFLDFFKTFEKEKDQSQSDPQKKSFSTLFANELEKMQKTREELKATSLSKEDANE